LILAFTVAAVVVITQVPTRLGLDLRGGSQLTLQVKPTATIANVGDREMEAVQSVVEGRVNGLGVSEALVQQLGNNQLLIQLPGVSDPEQAERVLGGTAQLEFRAQRQGTEGQLAVEKQVLQGHLDDLAAAQNSLPEGAAIPVDAQARLNQIKTAVAASEASISALFEPSQLTGDKLTDALARPGNGTQWVVDIKFNAQGAEDFANLTRSVAGTGRGLGIFLDNRLLSAPTVDVKYAETGISGAVPKYQGISLLSQLGIWRYNSAVAPSPCRWRWWRIVPSVRPWAGTVFSAVSTPVLGAWCWF
jgi:preprotein translocase subunit SecD